MGRSAAPRACSWEENLLAAPLRLTLVEECVEAFAEVVAHVTHEDQVLPLFPREAPCEAGGRLLSGVERQRRVSGNERGELLSPFLQCGKIVEDLIEEAQPPRLLRIDQ